MHIDTSLLYAEACMEIVARSADLLILNCVYGDGRKKNNFLFGML
jgi:hypothetical protein